MDPTELLLSKFAEKHPRHVRSITDLAGSPRVCCAGEDSDEYTCDSEHEDGLEKQKEAAEEVMEGVSPHLTYFVPRHMAVSDSEWRSMLTSIRTFYRWCVAEKLIEENKTMDKALLSLRKLPLDSLPKIISWLGVERYWNKIENGDQQAVNAVEGDVQNWQKRNEERFMAQYRSGRFTLGCFDQESDYERVFRMDDRFEVQEIRDDGWLLQHVNARYGYDKGEKVFLRLPTYVAKLGVLGLALSCLHLGLRKGIWRPLAWDNDDFAANAYPSKDMFEPGNPYSSL